MSRFHDYHLSDLGLAKSGAFASVSLIVFLYRTAQLNEKGDSCESLAGAWKLVRCKKGDGAQLLHREPPQAAPCATVETGRPLPGKLAPAPENATPRIPNAAASWPSPGAPARPRGAGPALTPRPARPGRSWTGWRRRAGPWTRRSCACSSPLTSSSPPCSAPTSARSRPAHSLNQRERESARVRE